METASSILINGAVIILLWGLVWKSNNIRLDAIQASVEKRVEIEYCSLKHRTIHDDIHEIKKNQEQMTKTLEQIKMSIAREDGRRTALERK
jgi:predicted Holliday junction resolvase-like endonuclease